jgi:UDP-N-acetylmuramyl pentapeptide phosphotransferase/UDP-N-acetylglucosamine-1-phosphate transferase
MLISSAALFLSSAILSWLLTWLLIPVLERGFMDTPNQRSSHIRPTPRGGGLAFVVIGTLLHVNYTTGPSRWVPLICLPLAFVGLVDDFKGLPAVVRYVVQVGTALGLIAISSLPISNLFLLLFVLLITAIINFTNFMDGLDGLVAGCAVLLMATTSSWAISGAIFGFLIWNWAPAKVFMGDVGSTFIGAVFGGMLLQTSSSHDIFHLLLVAFPLMADSFFCLSRRLIHRENIFKAHRKHLFQRLQQAGWSHQRVALLYIVSTAILLGAYKFVDISALQFAIICEFLFAVYLDMRVASTF